MTVALTMIVKDEAPRLTAAIQSARGLVDEVFVLDTGSTDDTVLVAEELGAYVVSKPWEGFGLARTQALNLAYGADWVLMIDADMLVEHHPDLKDWLSSDPDPAVSAWQVQVADGDLRYRLPMLTRGGLEWRYEGVTHEYLDATDRKQRPLLGLTLNHFPTPGRTGKHERDLELLAPLVLQDDPRATYYSAQALWCLGNLSAAADLYERRAAMVGTWEEERWHAQYMAARLREDVPALLLAHAARPHRHEPLSHAARLTEARGSDDVLFLETTGSSERM
jgi:hypothetical protein